MPRSVVCGDRLPTGLRHVIGDPAEDPVQEPPGWLAAVGAGHLDPLRHSDPDRRRGPAAKGGAKAE